MADRRLLFVQALEEGLDMAQACRTFGISRPTGYQIRDRFRQEGVAGLYYRSRAPHHSPQAVERATIDQILALKAKHPTWGPKKLKAHLEQGHSDRTWPAASTIGDMLKRAGLVKPRKARSRCPSAPILSGSRASNTVWCVDYKGQFSLGNREWCYPLTMTDLTSRFLIRCQGLPDVSATKAWPYFVGAFQEFGLPEAIRSDNGAPFAMASTTGLTRLSLQLIKLGIRLERITPGKPQENGCHERMHRTLKAEAIDPASPTMAAQQERLKAWRHEYNHERPHEALGQKTPASIYVCSPRPFPLRMPELEYPGGMRVQRVRKDGTIRWRGGLLFVSEVLVGEPIGMDHYTEHYQALYVGHQPVAILDQRSNTFLPPKQARPLLVELTRTSHTDV